MFHWFPRIICIYWWHCEHFRSWLSKSAPTSWNQINKLQSDYELTTDIVYSRHAQLAPHLLVGRLRPGRVEGCRGALVNRPGTPNMITNCSQSFASASKDSKGYYKIIIISLNGYLRNYIFRGEFRKIAHCMLFQVHKPSCEPNWNWVSSLGRRQGNSISISVWNRTQGEAVHSSLHIIHSSYILYPIRQVITEEDSRRLFETVGKCSEFVFFFWQKHLRNDYPKLLYSFLRCVAFL